MPVSPLTEGCPEAKAGGGKLEANLSSLDPDPVSNENIF